MQPGEITSLLHRLQSGDHAALNALSDITYPELRRIAEVHFRKERPEHLLQPTALVNEVWQKFIAMNAVQFSDRTHFFALCSRFMRQILVDHARRRVFHEHALSAMPRGKDITTDPLELDMALGKLEESQPRAAKVVELRYFGGMSVEEIAEALGVSPATVKRDWLAARAWLHNQLYGPAK